MSELDAVLAIRARDRLYGKETSEAVSRANKMEAQQQEYASATSPGQSPMPEAPPVEGMPHETAPQDPLAGIGPQKLPGTPAQRLRHAGRATQYVDQEIKRADPNRIPETPAPTSPFQSSSEEVRNRAQLPQAPVDLKGVGDKGARRTVERIEKTATGEEKGLAGITGVQLNETSQKIADQFGIPRDAAARVIDTALAVINAPSTMGGLSVTELLKEYGIEGQQADMIGTAAEVAISGLFQGATAGAGLGAVVKNLPGMRSMVVGAQSAYARQAAQQAGQIPQIVEITHRTGGATWNLAEGRSLAGEPKFAVAIAPERGMIVEGPVTERDLTRFIRRNADLFNELDNVNVGTWSHEGKTYYDVSIAVDSKEEALLLGQRYRQLAVMDLQTFEEIPVPVQNTTGHFIYANPAGRLRDADVKMAQIYDSAPEFDHAAVEAWDNLAAETDRLAAEIENAGIKMELVTGQPYQTAADMKKDIARGVLKVTTDNSEHPLWDVNQNARFRFVHDYIGHELHGHDFSLDGEFRAYQVHARGLTDDAARRALMVEVYGQAAAAIAHGGEFQVQKVFLPDDAAMDLVKMLPVGERIPGQEPTLLKRLQDTLTTWNAEMDEVWKRRLGAGVAGAGVFVDQGEGEQAQAGAPANLHLLQGLGAVLSKGKIARNSKEFGALVSKGASLIYHGVSNKNLFSKAMQQEFGPAIVPYLEDLYPKAKAKFKEVLDGLELRATKDIDKFFRFGSKYPDWYGVRDEIVEVFGNDAQRFAKLLAATSPQTAVVDIGAKEGNVTMALRAYEMLKNGATRAEIKDEFPLHYKNVMRAWADEELSGNKVAAFWKAIMGDESQVVIDTHMIQGLVDPSSARQGINPDTKRPVTIKLTETNSPNDHEYEALSEVVRQYAQLHGVSPRYAQQAIWLGRKMLETELSAGEVVEPLMDTVRRYMSERNASKEVFEFFDGMAKKTRDTFAAGSIILGAVAIADQLGDSEAGAEEYLAAAGLTNPRAAKALAPILRMLRRATPAVEVGKATISKAQALRALDTSNIVVGNKMLSIDWELMGKDPDTIISTLQRVKQFYDVEGVHSVSRGVVTGSDEKALAAYLREIGFDDAAVLSRQAGQAVSSTWVWAAADVTRKALGHLEELEKTVASMERGMRSGMNSPVYVKALLDFGAQAELVGALARALDGAAEEAGRALQAFQAATDLTGAPKLSFLRERNALIENKLRQPLTAVAEPGALSQATRAGRRASQGAPEGTLDITPSEPVQRRPARPPGSQALPVTENPLAQLEGLVGEAREFGGKPPAPRSQPEFPYRGGPKEAPVQEASVSLEKGQPRQQSTMAKLQDTIRRASDFGPDAQKAASDFEQMMQRPEVQDLLFTAQELRKAIKSLPGIQRPGFIRLAAQWGWDMMWEAFFSSMLNTIPGNMTNITVGGLSLVREAGIRYLVATSPITRLGENAPTYGRANAYMAGLIGALGEGIINGAHAGYIGKSQVGGLPGETKMGQAALSGARAAEVIEAGARKLPQAAQDLIMNPAIQEPIKHAFDVLGLMLNHGSRGMIATDDAYKTLAFRASLHEQAWDFALTSGHRVDTQDFRDQMALFLAQPPDWAVKIARAHAEHVTFTKQLGGALGGLGRFLSNPVTKPFVPFFNVSVNILETNFDQLPTAYGRAALAAMSNKVKSDLLEGGPKADIANAKIALGTVSLALAAWMYHEGMLTGRIVDEKPVKRHSTEQNIQPDSFIWKDRNGKTHFFPLNRLDPVTGPFLLVADMLDVYYSINEEDRDDFIEKMGVGAYAVYLGGIHNWTERSWNSGLKDFLEATTANDARDVAEGLKKFRRPFETLASWPTGQAGAQIERFRYPIMPETYDFIDALYARLPYGTISFDPKTGQQVKNPYAWFGGKDRTLYGKRNAKGEVILEYPWWQRVAKLTPVPGKEFKPDPVSNALALNEVAVNDAPRALFGPEETGMPTKRGQVPGVTLTAAQRDRLGELKGNGIKLPGKTFHSTLKTLGYDGELPEGKVGMWDLMSYIVKTDKFKNLQSGPGSAQSEVLSAIINGYYRGAVGIMFATDLSLRDRYFQRLEKATAMKYGEDARLKLENVLKDQGMRDRVEKAVTSPSIQQMIESLTR